VLAALLSTSFGAAVPAAGAATNSINCNTNVFLDLVFVLKFPTEYYCSKATICTGKKERPEPMDDFKGRLDTFVSTFFNPMLPGINEKVEKAFAGCQKSCTCTNYNQKGQ
jgi:hypothetical protein